MSPAVFTTLKFVQLSYHCASCFAFCFGLPCLFRVSWEVHSDILRLSRVLVFSAIALFLLDHSSLPTTKVQVALARHSLVP